MTYNILHLSDLHYSKRNADQSTYIREAFLRDLRDQVLRLGKPEIVVFSGDIVNDPDEPDVYLYAIDDFVDHLCKITGVPSERIVICPGNHDVSRKAQGSEGLKYRAIISNRGDSTLFSKLYEKGDIQEYALSVSKQFFEFAEFLGQPWADPLYRIYPFAGATVAATNAAFSCSLEGSRADRGKLFLPLSAWAKAMDAMPEGCARIITNHFPLAEFDESHERVIGPDIRQCELFCYGHVHNTLPHNVVTADGSAVLLQAGALYENADEFKGYSFSIMEHKRYVGIFRGDYPLDASMSHAL